ncbi:MAG TPA: OmpH family outer membrane protein [Geminicoccaceae bacterium]|nr:OmpH family outer membrane protein [Geminicoccaceae bacterium]
MSEQIHLVRSLVVSGLLAGILTASFSAGDAQAQQLPPAVVAVIDYQRILRDSAAARSIREQVEARRNAYQEEINKQEQRLREADKEVAKQRSLLTTDAFAEKRRQYEQDVAQVQKMVQDRRRELDSVSAGALNEVKKALIAVVTGIADERGFNIVLPTSDVLFFARKIDLTDEVLAKLDESLPDVRVPKATE